MIAAVPHHARDAIESLFARDAQLVLQVQVGSRQKHVQPRLGRGFKATESRVHIFLTGASERGHAGVLDLGGDGARCFEIAGRSNRKTGLDDIRSEFFDRVSELEFFFRVHGKTWRLLAIAERGIEDTDDFHGHSISKPGDRKCRPRNSFTTPPAGLPAQTLVPLHWSAESGTSPIYNCCKQNKCTLYSDQAEKRGRKRGPNLDLASLHVFQTVAREQSFSRAAEKLYRTQPAVSIA